MTQTQSDLHLHTLVSDGTCDAVEMLNAAMEAGLERISFTDHDAVGAYRHFHPNLFSLARGMGIELIPGIELDTEYMEHEVHLLGYQIDVGNAALNTHLRKTQNDRRIRVGKQVIAINTLLGETVITKEELFLPQRDTLMKPHLIHGLLRTGRWGDDYLAAQAWLAENIKVSAKVFKPSIRDGIALIHGAGGQAVLAHPGFLSVEHGFSLEQILRELKELGLDGVELEYPYTASPKLFSTQESETTIIDTLRELAEHYSLFTTRGSDAHEPVKLIEFANRQTRPTV